MAHSNSVKNLLRLATLSNEKFELLRKIAESIKLKEIKLEPLKKEMRILCEKARKTSLQEQKIELQFRKAKANHLSHLQSLRLEATKVLNLIHHTENNPKLKEIKNLLENLPHLESKDRGAIHSLLTVVWLLTDVYRMNSLLISLFSIEEYPMFIKEVGESSDYHLTRERVRIIELLRLHTPLLENSDEQEQELINSFLKDEQKEHSLLKKLAKKVQHDEETMNQNADEQKALEVAQREGLHVFSSKDQNTRKIVKSIGEEYSLVSSHNTISVYWDTIPIVHNTLAALIEFIGMQWKKYFPKIFKQCTFVPLTISGLSRTLEEQAYLRKTSPYATKPRLSSHVHGLAVDFATLETSKNIVRSLPDQRSQLEAVQGKVMELLLLILKNFTKKKVHKAPLVTAFFEGNGCYHVSINPDPDAINKIREIINQKGI